MKNKNRIQLFIILNTVLLLVALVSIYYTEGVKNNRNNDKNVLGESISIEKDITYTHNIAPSSVEVGSIYDFNLHLYLDTDVEPSISIVSLPLWLNADSTRVYGIPNANDLGNHKLEYEINVDGQISKYIVDILVFHNEE